MNIKGFTEDQAKTLQEVIDKLNESQKAKFDELAEKAGNAEALKKSIEEYGNELSELSEEMKRIEALTSKQAPEKKDMNMQEAIREKLLSEFVGQEKFQAKSVTIDNYSQKGLYCVEYRFS